MSKTGSRRWLGSGRAPRTLLPGDVRLLGWWSSGPLPGSPAGTVVIDGHVDDRGGPAALFRLARTPVGSALVLQTPAGVLRYVMQAAGGTARTSCRATCSPLPAAHGWC